MRKGKGSRGGVAVLIVTLVAAGACGGSSGLVWEDFDRSYPSVATRDGYVWDAGAVSNAVGGLVGDLDDLIDGEGLVALYSFETGGISDDAVVESAVLRLYQENVIGAPYAAPLDRMVVDLVQIGTELDLADFDGGTLASNVGTLADNATLEWKSVDVTASVQADVSAGRTHSEFRIRFMVESDSDGNNDVVWLNDGEGYRASGRLPELVVSYRAPRL